MENPIKMDDLGVPVFLETSTYTRHTLKTCKIFQMIFVPRSMSTACDQGTWGRRDGWDQDLTWLVVEPTHLKNSQIGHLTQFSR